MEFNQLVAQYLTTAEYQALTDNTKANYKSKLKVLETMGGSWKKVMAMRVTNSTKNVYLAVLKTMYSTLEKNGIISNSPRLPQRGLRVTSQDRNHYTKEEIEALWEATRGHSDAVYTNFLRFCFYTGCRPSEAINLKWKHINKGYIEFWSTKYHEHAKIGRKCAIIPPIDECLEVAGKLCGDNHPEWPIFRSTMGCKMDISGVRKAIKNITMRHDMEYKQLRHTRSGLATAMYRAGYSIYDIQGQLGHSSIGTTQRYIRPSMEERANAYKGV